MRRSICTALLLAVSLIFTACQNESPSSSLPSSSQSQPSSQGSSTEAPSAPESSQPESSVPDTPDSSAPESSSSEAEGSSQPQSAPSQVPSSSSSAQAGAFAFRGYDETNMTSEKRSFQLEGTEGSATVYLLPKGNRAYVEVYQDGVSFGLCKLNKEGEGYWEEGMGTLSGDDTWVGEAHSLKAGDRFDITMNEAGFYEYYSFVPGEGKTRFFFEVQ